jgi:hypothetical protein
VLGAFRALSYGSLYPCLHELLAAGLIAEEHDEAEPTDPGRRVRDGRAKIRPPVAESVPADRGRQGAAGRTLLGEGGPAAWEDDEFGVHFAFFGQTRADVRLRILEGRRSRLEERMEAIRAAFTRTRERVDSYTLELHRHGLESVEREVRWLNELIASERSEASGGHRRAGGPDNISEKESS